MSLFGVGSECLNICKQIAQCLGPFLSMTIFHDPANILLFFNFFVLSSLIEVIFLVFSLGSLGLGIEVLQLRKVFT